MRVYVTPFDHNTKLCSGPSIDSGFVSMGQVLEAMGPSPYPKTPIYGEGKDRVIFSTFIFSIDGAVT